MRRKQKPRTGAYGWSALLLAVAACSYTPARFRDADAVKTVRDDDPIPVPPPTDLPDWARYSEVYVRRTIVGGLDTRRIPDAADVNSLDEVPKSSWFEPDRPPGLDGYVASGAPTPPFAEQPRTKKEIDAGVPRHMIDGKGLRWRLVVDDFERRWLQSSAAAISSRLVYALGYHAAETHIVSLSPKERAVAVRWPAARAPYDKSEVLDLGPTVHTGTRLDDPNDVIDHEDRRSLRALGTVAAWIGLDQIRPDVLRDVYVGSAGKGFVQHHVVVMEDSLGAGALLSALRGDDDGKPAKNAWVALGTLGLSAKEGPDPSDTPYSTVGLFFLHVDPADFDLSPPFPPAQDALLADAYWIAKRMTAISADTIAAAVAGGQLEPFGARAHVERALIARRLDVARFAMSFVTPLELNRTTAVRARRSAGPFFELQLHDVAIGLGFTDADTSRYEVEILDNEGDPIIDPIETRPRGATVTVRIPTAELEKRGYLIVRARAVRDGARVARSVELHVHGSGKAARVRGIRH